MRYVYEINDRFTIDRKLTPDEQEVLKRVIREAIPRAGIRDTKGKPIICTTNTKEFPEESLAAPLDG